MPYRKYDIDSLEGKKLVELLYDLEEMYANGKVQTKLFAQILTFFLFACILTIVSIFYHKYFPKLPIEVYQIINFGFMVYGIFLLVRGIIHYIKIEKYLKILKVNIDEIKKTLKKKNIDPNQSTELNQSISPNRKY